MQSLAKTLFVILVMVQTQAFANKIVIPYAPKPSSSLPKNCELIKPEVQNQTILLDGPKEKNKSLVYFIKNKSKKSLWLDHPTKHTGASAGWSSFLQTDKWSAVVIDKKQFSVSCSVIHPGKIEYLNCSEALTVCLPSHDVSTNRRGTFWLIENKSLEDFQKHFSQGS